MDNSFSSDRPISQQVEDKFQRYDFSKRIAKTIIDRENEDCIVIGIYGAWGEGKTSVINFIETELKKTDNIIAIKFNPWRYNDEVSLLIQFFQKLANALDTNLKTKKEKVGELLKKYGKLLSIDVPVIGNIGEKVEGVGELLGDVDIETLKTRIENILKETKSKIVVFIDDIDRLDKNEIHSIFRLVKLTADFSNTTYLLSFDEEMVSAAIGERFGAGNQQSGQNFLEKIIQVPIKIPVAQPEALKQFCFGLVNKALNSNNIQLSEDEARRFVSEFTSNVLQKLDTPRLAVRYGNTLSFSLPLLYGEANMIDLMLIEAIKIFYPDHYAFIKTNPEYFIGSYSDSSSHGKDNDKINSIKQELEELSKNLTKSQANNIQKLLCELFPRLNEVFSNRGFNYGNFNEWFKNKRIASPKYFNRYFSYVVITGEVSDISFQTFLSQLSEMSISEMSNELQTLISQSSAENVLYKLRSIEKDFEWNSSVKLAQILSVNSSLFPSDKGLFSFGFDDPNGQAAIFIYQLIKNHSNKLEQFELAKLLMVVAQPFEFAHELNNWFRVGDTIEQKIFTAEQYTELGMQLVKRAKKEAGPLPIFEKFPDQITYLFEAWAEYDKKELLEYVETFLINDPTKCIQLLLAFTATGYSTAVVGSYKTDFDKQHFEYITSIIDTEVISKAIDKTYSEAELSEEPIAWLGRGKDGKNQTTMNIIRQFKHWYNEQQQRAEK